MVSSASSILRTWIRIQQTQSSVFSNLLDNLMSMNCEKEAKVKRPELAQKFKMND